MLEPAHTTKHLPFLHIPFREHVFVLAQADDGVSNGTTLWLGGQLLAAYIASLPIPPKSTARVIELGSGIGFTALVLASLGYHVLATDGHPSVLALLTQNIQRNAQNLPAPFKSASLTVGDPELRVAPPVFDLIVTADTLYVPHLTPHLLRTLDHLQALTPVTGSSLSSPSSDSNHQPKVNTNRADNRRRLLRSSVETLLLSTPLSHSFPVRSLGYRTKSFQRLYKERAGNGTQVIGTAWKYGKSSGGTQNETDSPGSN
ncbi:Lysine methyltransferase [Rhizoctonia solani]|uniref:Lysine methyltransferase n=1 Tax=Rhizoctonia solani TaxID=456999 RepID=A0A8H7IIX4_9AGAM|nr:Lysine methyltransferase [Rhizoctonia solani]